MMKSKWPYLTDILLGIALFATSFFIKDEYYSAILLAGGIGMAATALVHILRISYWESPKRRGKYELRKQEAHINFVDERKQYLRMKSGHISYQLMCLVLFVLAFALALFKAPAWVIAMVFLLSVGQYLLGIAVFHWLEKRL